MTGIRLVASLVLLLAVVPAQAAQNLLFIMDASGSMWGRIDGQPKIAVAREVMSDLVAELPADAHAGLIAYGHNRKGDCRDIETLRPLGALDREGLIRQIQGLNPKGKTPITATVRHAVRELRMLEEPASVVLVSDGLESCGGDPCAAVREAREAGVDFRMHVVGFDLGEADTAQLQCMAEAADGRYYEASNAAELAEALKEAVQVSPGLLLEVTANEQPTAAEVTVRRRGESDPLARFDVRGDADGNPRLMELPAGSYDIEVAATEIAGAPEKRLDGLVIPEKGEISRRVDFSDGRLVLRVTSNGEPLEARSYVYDADTDKEADRHRTDEAGEARYRLGPGTYRVKVRPDGIDAPERLLEDIVIDVGETVTRTVDYASGRAEITVTANGEPLRARTYLIDAETDKEAARGRTDDRGVAGYDVPTGTYYIKVRPDGIDAPNRHVEDVVVSAGETTEVATDYSSGRAEITVTANGQPLKARTYLIDAETDKEAARGRTDDRGVAGYDVPTGSYYIKVRPDGIDAPNRHVEDVLVTAGETTAVATDYSSGRAEITVTANGQPLEARTYLIDAETDKEAARGRTNDQGVAGYDVPTGTYYIKVRPDGIDAPNRRIEDVVVTAGETTEVATDYASGQAQVTVTTNGRPLEARTYLVNADTDKEAARGRTDDRGIARYDVPVGTYYVKVRPEGIDGPDQRIDDIVVRADEMARHRLDIPSGRLELSVMVAGEALDARTYLKDAETGKEVSRSGTDDAGVARYRVPTGTYRLRVRPDGIDAPDRVLEDVTVSPEATTTLRLDFADESS